MRTILRGLMCSIGMAAVLAVGAMPLHATSSNVTDINSFINCVNNTVPKAGYVADAVSCLPPGCSISLTMSTASAQAACTLASCQLPRVLMVCPGTTGIGMRPSFLLCPEDSGSAPAFGVDRIEIGQDLNNAVGSIMSMADVPLPPGNAKLIDPDTTISTTTTDQGCNGCHTPGANQAGTLPSGAGATLLTSEQLDPFGPNGFNNGANFVISTDEFKQQASPTSGTAQGLNAICACVAQNQAAIGTAASNPHEKNIGVVLGLCRALNSYQYSKGVCQGITAKGVNVPTFPPACATAGVSGQFKDGGSAAFQFGIAIVTSGTTFGTTNGPFTYANPYGFLGGTDPVTAMPIVLTTFQTAQLTLLAGPNHFSLTGTASALVNGAAKTVNYTATSNAGGLSILVTDSTTSVVYASGTGVKGKSSAGYGIAPPPS